MRHEMDIGPPQVLKERLSVPDKLMMGPGPSNCTPRVLYSMSEPVLGHLHTETLKLMDEVKEGIRYIFQTRNELTLALSATGHGGMEASLCNMLAPGDHALILVAGHWGERASDMATRYGARVTKINVPPGRAATVNELENEVIKHKPDILFVTHGESSTGVMQPLEGLGDACHRHGCLLVVDSVAALGGTPVFMDKWGIDVLYTGTQKVLGVPPGITPMSFSPLAQDRIFSRTTPIPVYYWDMKLLGLYWGCFGDDKPRIYHHTVPVNLIYALREGLAEFSHETLEKSWARHALCAKMMKEGLTQLGMQLFVPEDKHRLPTIISVRVPEGRDWKRIISYAMDRYRLEISGGLGPTVGKIFRIGLMGYNATPENVQKTIRVLKEAIEHTQMSKNKM